MKNNINKYHIEDSVIHYEIDSKKGRLDLFIETDEDGDTLYIVKDFNGKGFLLTDFEQFKKVLDFYQN